MAITNESALIDALATRVRDPNSTAHTRADLATILTHCYRLVNAATDTETSLANVTFAANQPLVSLFATLAFSIRVLTVGSSSTQRLTPVPDWRWLASHDPLWFRRTADYPSVWGMIGRDLLFVWPAPRVATVFSVAYVSASSISDSIGASIGAQQMNMPILDLAEQVVLLRHRLLASMKPAAAKFQAHIQTRAVHE